MAEIRNDMPGNEFCIIGIGNPLRSDDGLGEHVCRLLQQMHWDNLTIQTTQQLQTEWLLELSNFKHVLIIDAASGGYEPEIRPVNTNKASHSSNISHHLNVEMLAGLMHTLNGSTTRFYILAIPGENFEFGESLSGSAYANAEKSVILIREWIGSLRSETK